MQISVPLKLSQIQIDYHLKLAWAAVFQRVVNVLNRVINESGMLCGWQIVLHDPKFYVLLADNMKGEKTSSLSFYSLHLWMQKTHLQSHKQMLVFMCAVSAKNVLGYKWWSHVEHNSLTFARSLTILTPWLIKTKNSCDYAAEFIHDVRYKNKFSILVFVSSKKIYWLSEITLKA